MKTAIMGAGGVGGFYGARMVRGGMDVQFVARGDHLNALQQEGLHVFSPTQGDFHIPKVQATDDPTQIGPVDVVWMTVKAYGLAEAAQAILPLIGPDTLVIPLLNGVDAADQIGAVVGQEHMAGGVVYVSAFIDKPGTIRHMVADRMVFGDLAGADNPRLKALHDALHGVGIEAELSGDIRQELWEKYCGLAATALVSSASRANSGTLVRHPELMALYIQAMEEIRALAQAQGIEVRQEAFDRWRNLPSTWPPETKPSMLLDLERGRPMELEALAGTAVRLGQQLGVPTPVFSALYPVLKPYADGQG